MANLSFDRELAGAGKNPDQPIWFLVMSRDPLDHMYTTWRVETCLEVTLSEVGELYERLYYTHLSTQNRRETQCFFLERTPGNVARLERTPDEPGLPDYLNDDLWKR